MKPLVIIAGPTAVGKSDLAVQLAKRINGEIISADSVQVYKGMDIGSAKITTDEMQGIKHYLIDVYDPLDDYNVCVFQKMASLAVEEVLSKNKIPIICGGTGFYIQALLYNIDFDESSGEISEYRQYLEDLYKEKGADYLFDMLKAVDEESTNIIHKNNVKRVIRALEFYHETGKPISEHNKEQREKESEYNYCYFVLNDLRELIYQRIDARVDKMIQMGLVDEVKALKDRGLNLNHVSMQALGYKEILMFLDNQISLDEAIYLIKRDSRHFAKRQLTWFNRESDINWINRQDFACDNEAMINYMINLLREKEIIKLV